MVVRRARPAAVVATLGALLAGGLAAAGPVLPAAQPARLAAAADEPSVRFTAAGDYSANANTRAVLATTKALDPDLNLALGDLSYGLPGEEQQWCDFVTREVGAGFPFELVAGNHESDGRNGAINDFAACLPNQLPGLVGTYGRQWYVDVPAADPLVRVVAISPALAFPDGTWSYAAGTPRYQWTAAAIDGARAAGVPWVVVALHKPCVSLGDYGCDPGADITNLLLDREVDLVLNGHEHLYQRTHQLALGAACPGLARVTADPDCVVDDDDAMVKGAGTVVATVGTGGQTLRPVHTDDGEAPYFAAASGLATPTWGVLDVEVTETQLTAGFVRAAGGTFTDAFTITAGGGANTPPVPAFTASCTGLRCTFDGSASTDPDGTVTAWRWDLGDGGTATGPTTTRTFGASGTYTVALTVTDDAGASRTTTRVVTVTAPSTAFAADAFGRTVSGGWGTADVGGAWRTAGPASAWSVAGGTGALLLATPGGTADAALPATAPGADLRLTASLDKAATGGGVYVTVGARRVAGVGEYRANVRLRSSGVVALGLARTAGSTETVLTPVTVVPGLTLAPGARLAVRVQAVGTSPTTLRAKVWLAGTTEPAAWQTTATDATAGLQAAGSTGLNVYLSSSASNAPLTLRVDDVTATAP